MVYKTWSPIAQSLIFERLDIEITWAKVELLIDTARSKIITHLTKHFHYARILCIWSSMGWFPNLNRLELYQIFLDPEGLLPSDVLGTSLRPRTSIKTTKLTSTRIILPQEGPVPTILEYLFNLFPAVETLQCWYTQAFEDKYAQLIAPNPVVPPLRRMSSNYMLILPAKFAEHVQPFFKSLNMLDYTGMAVIDQLPLFCRMKGSKHSLKTLRFGIDSRATLRMLAINILPNTIDFPGSEAEGYRTACYGYFILGHVQDLWNSLELRNLTVLETIHIVIERSNFLIDKYILPTLPKSTRTLAFELAWAEHDKPDSCLDGLEQSFVERCIEQNIPNIKEAVFMPHYLVQELQEPVHKLIRKRLVNLDARGLLRISNVCERLDGCQYRWYSDHPHTTVG